MAISKTKIKQRTRNKTDSSLVETINLAKGKGEIELAQLLSMPTRKRAKKNLFEIDKEAIEGMKVLVPGKVLGKGMITKKIEITALSYSSSASEKLKKLKIPATTIKEELEKSSKLQAEVLR